VGGVSDADSVHYHKQSWFHSVASGSGTPPTDFLGKAMAIIINIDVMLAKRKMSVTELADRVGITMANISILKNGKAKAIRLSTLEAICKALQCQPGDLLEYQ
jgi:putative transcriptional regulator